MTIVEARRFLYRVRSASFGYDPDLKPYAYDPKKARELLRAAGFPNGFEVPCYNLITPREPNIKEMGEAYYAYLTASGIRCKVVALEYAAWINLGRRDTGWIDRARQSDAGSRGER